jgi:SAM-dependent methyltransferase
MPSDLFEIEPAAIKSAAALLANRLLAVAKPHTPEQTLRIAFQGAVDEIARKLKFNLDWRDEYRLIGGRADTVYGGLVVEYEPPCSLRHNNKTGANAHAIQQVKDYLSGLQKRERHNIERYAGAVCDGIFFIFLRYKEGHWHTEPPVPVTPYSCERFLRYLFALQTELATTPENLLRDFGESSSNAHACVRAFYASLANSTVPKVGTLYRQWAQSFSEVCGYEENSPRLDVAALAKTYDVSPASGEKINPFKLFFAVHSYYATFIKLLAVQILYFYARQKVARIAASEPVTLAQAASLDSKGLHAYLVDLEEQGGIFGYLGIRNFLEGDFFGWYLEGWDQPTDSSLRAVIRQLSNYSFVTLDIDPDGTRDLLKKLYQNLMPKELRHDLGEYYTPDWLAEQVLNQLHSGTPEKSPRSPDERLLDPACGSGTFLVLHIRAVRQHARDVLLPQNQVTPKQLLDRILCNVVGYDLNPLAVISARTNYLLALGDLLEEIKGDIDIPVYLADSVLTPSGGNGELTLRAKFSFKTAVGVFSLPVNLIKADYIDELTNLLESCVQAHNSPEVFRQRLCSTLPLHPQGDAADVGIVEALYSQLLDLDRQQINGIWARIIKNAFAPLFQPPFDVIAGNPPWINWESLPDDYRQQTAPLWQKYGLFTHTGLRARLGGAKDDLSVLMLYVAADKYLKPKGKLGFVITQTIFKTEGGGAGFRRLKLGADEPLRVIQVDDFSSIQCFEGATNRTAVVIIEKSSTNRFPVPWNFWRPRQSRTRIATEADHDEAMELLTYSPWDAKPLFDDDVTSSWITGKRGAINRVQNAVGGSEYKARAGCCGWLNSVYWLTVTTQRPDGNLLIANFTERAKVEVKNVTATIEPDLTHPLVRGRDISKWQAASKLVVLVPQDPDQPSRGYPEAKLQVKLPKTAAYLQQFESALRKRSGYKQYFKPGLDPYYSVYNVGPYTFSPVKVCWMRISDALHAAVVEGERVVPDNSVVFVSLESREEAHYVCALLNSSIAEFLIRSFSVPGNGTWASPHILTKIRIPKFDAKNKQHVRLSENSVACHAAAPSASETDIAQLETTVNETAAAIWDISAIELRAIESSLADLQ